MTYNEYLQWKETQEGKAFVPCPIIAKKLNNSYDKIFNNAIISMT